MAFTDSFTDTDGTALESHTPTGGTSWTRQDGVAGAAVCTGNELRSVSTTRTSYVCDDQGSADHYVIHKCVAFGTSIPNSMVCCRLADANNAVGWRLVGTGSSGRRLSKVVTGTVTDLITSQGVSSEWIKVEASGSTVKLFEGGTGATPGTWNQVGTDQTYSENTTETSQGVLIASSVAIGWVDDFDVGALGGGGTTLYPSLLSDGETFYTPTVTAGAVTLAPSLYADGETFYSPTVALSGVLQTLTPSLYTDDDSFFSATVTVGAVALAPTPLNSANAFFDATVANRGWLVTPSASGSWSDASAAANGWTPASAASGSWSDVSDAVNSWSDATPAAGSWTIQ